MTDTATREPVVRIGRRDPPQAGSHPPGTGPGARRARLVGASVLACVLIGWGAVTIISLLAHEERTTTDEFAGVRSVTIDNDHGWVTVRSIDSLDATDATDATDAIDAGDTVTVERTISEGLRTPDVSDEIVDGVLHLRSSCSRITSIWCGVTYTVDVPAGIDVTVRSDNGSVELSGAMGAVVVDGDNSSIDATGLEARQLRLETDNGSIRAQGPLASDVVAETSNGSVRLFFDDSPSAVDARSRNGAVEVVVPPDGEAYRVDTSTSRGSETVTVPTDPASDRTIDARTRNGSVNVRTER